MVENSSTYEWSLIDNVSNNNHRNLDPEDVCYYYMTKPQREINEDGIHYLQRSTVASEISNLKKSVNSQGRLRDYKINAIRKFARDIKTFLLNVGLIKTECSVVLIPVPPSKAKTDPEYDPRIFWACRLVAKDIDNITVVDCLHQTVTTTRSHYGGTRDIDELISRIKFEEQHLNSIVNADFIFIVDDVLTTGAHYKACKKIISSITGDNENIAGIFWARQDNAHQLIDFETLTNDFNAFMNERDQLI